ncbi:ubiquitin-conjugating enzyme E2 R1 isoform X1 [Ailuropoda melanoleuca]|uniref:E2 ubiquitin-conjugating enzyme n=1 Tax=Ailuropoda melanoleuca TaxID=9646 RepID=A0A7N5JF33_AILME|nr:ubiquitin-conjugating enzyme E2 R1 isoform X1 [Ailuropoda melanoleuca]
MARPLVPSSQKALLLELKGLQEEPVEGFRVTLVDEGDLYNWEVAIFGPPNTYYEGGYFKARLKFPIDYPYSPPAFRFLTKMWHPNIYETGDVCISILHPPVDDPQSGELPSERWNPTQNVRTILLSVISLLNEPNTFSPANVDASVMYRKWKESKGKDREYTDIIRLPVGPLTCTRVREAVMRASACPPPALPAKPRSHVLCLREAGLGDQGGRGAGRREGAHHTGRVLCEDQGPSARRGLRPLLR